MLPGCRCPQAAPHSRSATQGDVQRLVRQLGRIVDVQQPAGDLAPLAWRDVAQHERQRFGEALRRTANDFQ